MKSCKRMQVECDCGCVILEIEQLNFYDEVSEYLLTSYDASFYAHQIGFWSLFKQRVKMAWYALCGKEYRLYELVLTSEQFEEFKQMVNNF